MNIEQNWFSEKKDKLLKNTEIILCPPFTALSVVSEVVKGTSIFVGAQNVYWEKSGAFTGEISADDGTFGITGTVTKYDESDGTEGAVLTIPSGMNYADNSVLITFS